MILAAAQPGNPHYLVVCYCAQWCDTCREYAGAFARLAEKWPQHTFIWVDIEESPELLGDEDVENFPTLLVQAGDKNYFFGPMIPHAGHLDKLLETGRTVLDPGKRTEAYQEAQKILTDDCVYIYLADYRKSMAMSPKVKGFTYSPYNHLRSLATASLEE